MKYSERSKANLESCHRDIRRIFKRVIRVVDCSILSGKRTAEEQFFLWKIGREEIDGVWVEVSDVVTHKDGYRKKSRHQSGESIDTRPYPITDKEHYFQLNGVIRAVQIQLLRRGKITRGLDWGWDLWAWDMDHYQLS